MSKVESPVKAYPGYVVLPDFLNILQVRAFEDAYFGDPNEVKEKGKRVFISVDDSLMIPFLVKNVLEWHLEKVPEKPTVETIPMTPVSDGHALIAWLQNEFYKIWKGEKDVPNA